MSSKPKSFLKKFFPSSAKTSKGYTDEILSKLSTLEKRFDSQEKEKEIFNAKLNEINFATKSLEKNLKENNGVIGKGLDLILQNEKSLNEQIKSSELFLVSNLDELDFSVKNLSNQITKDGLSIRESIKDILTALGVNIKSLFGTIEKNSKFFSEKLDTLKKHFEELESQINSTSNAVHESFDRLNNGKDALSAQVDNINKNLCEDLILLKQHSKTLNELITTRLDAIENSFSLLNGLSSNISDSVSNIKLTTQELSEKIANETKKYKLELSDRLNIANAELTDEIKEELSALRKNSDHILESFAGQVSETLSNQTETFQKAVLHIEDAIPNKTVYWTNKFERDVVRENWGDVTKRPDFEEKFLNLVSGMDSKSICAVTRILARQRKYLNSDQDKIDLFTREEQEQLRLLKEHFENEIFKVSDDLYTYKNYFLPVNRFESSVFYFRHGIDELETAKNVKGKAIIDVGGYIGDSVLVLSDLAPSMIYTFEAVPDNFEILKKTLEINHIQNAVAENVALSEKAGTMIMHVGGSSSTSIERPGIYFTKDIEVPVTTLDEYVETHGIQVGLIKVDIEGGEPGFLAGAKKTICEQKPIILLSIYHNAHDFFELKPLIESWNLGYKFKIHKPTFGSASGETLLLAEIRN